jgi:hypothetical protein
MSDEPEDSEIRDAEEVDPGEPISALAGFEQPASNSLVKRIRRTILRRKTLNHLASFSVNMPLVVLKEFWSILTHRPRTGVRKDASNGEKTS